MSIFDEIGGAAAVSAAVDDFYERVLGDPALNPYFTGTDMGRLKGHQRAFIAAAIGGPDPYLGRNMAEAHAGLAITPEDFDSVVGQLVATLTGLGVPDATIAAIGGSSRPSRVRSRRGPRDKPARPVGGRWWPWWCGEVFGGSASRGAP